MTAWLVFLGCLVLLFACAGRDVDYAPPDYWEDDYDRMVARYGVANLRCARRRNGVRP